MKISKEQLRKLIHKSIVKNLSEATGEGQFALVDAKTYGHLEVESTYLVKVGRERVKCVFKGWNGADGQPTESDDVNEVRLKFADEDDGMEWEAYWDDDQSCFVAGSSSDKLYVMEANSSNVNEAGFKPNTSKSTNTPKAALKVLNMDGFNWRPSAVRYASNGSLVNGWVLVNDETQEAFIVYPDQGDYEDTDYVKAVEKVEKAEAAGDGGRISVVTMKTESIDVELQKKGLRQALPNERGHYVQVNNAGKTVKVWATQEGDHDTRHDAKYGKLQRDVNEGDNYVVTDENVVAERAEDVSDNLNKLIGFATVFANIPRNIRLDVQRMVTGEDTDKIDVSNLKKAIHVLGELDSELDDAFLSYFEKHDDVAESAPPGGEKVVKALKKQPGIKNPWATAWSMKNKGDKFKK